ncbi:PTPRJ phosphatase, partial [Polyodon spathula]|nr:PTPRJ phosphatase [Polyodon spathula]
LKDEFGCISWLLRCEEATTMIGEEVLLQPVLGLWASECAEDHFPLPSTVTDLWRMVWEKNSFVIVMLTSLVEKTKKKCEQYWPEGSQTYGDVVVSLQAEEKGTEIITRTSDPRKRSLMTALQSTVVSAVPGWLEWDEGGLQWTLQSPGFYLHKNTGVKDSYHRTTRAVGYGGTIGRNWAQGLEGEAGSMGPDGIKGEKGDLGVEGEKGEKGELGLKGKEGPPGDPGMTGIRVSPSLPHT